MYIQQWDSKMQDSSRYKLYRQYKSLLEPEKYLTLLTFRKRRNMFTRFRAGNLSLKVNEGRWMGIDFNQRICPLCSKGIEDKYHFLLICKYYDNLRISFIPQMYYEKPTIYKFNQLLSTSSVELLNNVCKYLYLSFELRKEHLKC